MKNLYKYKTPIGQISIAESDGIITNLLFDGEILNESYQNLETPVLKKANQQLQEYFLGKRKEFDLPLKLDGTGFRKRVWEAMKQIQYGKTKSYKEIAQIIKNEKAVRAVGSACNKNPIPIIIPCHRVIGQKGDLVGYGGGLEMKQFLLELEKGNSKH